MHRFQGRMASRSRIDQDWRYGKRLLQILECLICFRTSFKLVFVGKASLRRNNLGIVIDEDPIEIGKAKKTLNILNGCWFLLFGDSLDFLGIHE